MKANTTRWLVVVLGVLFSLSLAAFLYGNYRAAQEAGDTIPLWTTFINALILSIPLGLLYTAIGVLIIGAQQHAEGHINPRLARLIYWSPRIAGILIIFFVSLFALDVFEAGLSIWEMLGGFAMHMLPSIAMMVALAVAWRREWLGFWLFLAVAAFFLVKFGSPGNVVLFVGPLFVIALLFGVNWRWRDELHPGATAPAS